MVEPLQLSRGVAINDTPNLSFVGIGRFKEGDTFDALEAPCPERRVQIPTEQHDVEVPLQVFDQLVGYGQPIGAENGVVFKDEGGPVCVDTGFPAQQVAQGAANRPSAPVGNQVVLNQFGVLNPGPVVSAIDAVLGLEW